MSLLADFHFLRPWALLLIVPLIAVVMVLWRSRSNHSRWQQLIAPELLSHLIDGHNQGQSRISIIALALAFTIACLALAGPAWEKQSSPVHRQKSALIIALDLSPSMVARDVKPSRLVRARLKVAELLKARKEGETALIVYADDAHLVTPLTDDTRTIAALLSTLTPGIMPMPGSRPEAAIKRALKMFNDAGYDRGDILLVTDGVAKEAEDEINSALNDTSIGLLILGVGTDAGAPIPSGRGGFIRDANNDVVITRLGSAQLQNLAQKNGGRYITNTIDQQDIKYLNPTDNTFAKADNNDALKQKMDQWLDRGPWLVLILLPIVLLSFRRGMVIAVLLIPLMGIQAPPLQAAEVDVPLPKKIFLTPDQRAAKSLKAGDAAAAAATFNDPLWKATAQYRAGNYEAAANSFAQHDSALAHYNRGNALANTGKLDEAIKAYQQALKIAPDMDDAKANLQLMENLKKQQQQQQEQQQEQDQSGEDSSESNQSSSEQNSQGQPQESKQDSDASQPNPSSSSTDDPSGSQQSSQQISQQESQQDRGQSDQQPSATSSNSPEEESRSQSLESRSSSSSQASNQDDGRDKQQTSHSSTRAGEADENTAESEQEAEARVQPLSPEEKEARQATEQWLRQIPDDPSGLLRNKFRYEYNQQRQDRQQKKLNNFGNSEQRW